MAAPERLEADRYIWEIQFVDGLDKDDVAVVRSQTGEAAVWGELFSTAAAQKGCAGAVVVGSIRDTARIEGLGFPVVATGVHPADCDQRVSLRSHDEPLVLGSVTIRVGDLIVADRDGLVAVPRLHAAEVIEMAVEKSLGENRARDSLLEGATLREAWDRHGVL